MIDTDALTEAAAQADEQAIGELHIHPNDMRELQSAFRFCWPNNSARDRWYGVRLIVDIEAPLLPRKVL